jgi:hypothetical protein
MVGLSRVVSVTNQDSLPERVEVIERKLDALSSSVDRRFDEVDKRFDEVRDAIVEQRQYTEFAFDRLQREMAGGFDRLERRITIETGRLERKIDQVLDLQRAPRRSTPRPRSPRKNR